jgi:hypothetical protein
MSPGNQGVFQLQKEVTFQRILTFYNMCKWNHFRPDGTGLKKYLLKIIYTIFKQLFHSHVSANLMTCFIFSLDFASPISDTLDQMSKAVMDSTDRF